MRVLLEQEKVVHLRPISEGKEAGFNSDVSCYPLRLWFHSGIDSTRQSLSAFARENNSFSGSNRNWSSIPYASRNHSLY